MKIVIEIDLGNEAMQTPVDVENAVAMHVRTVSDTAPLTAGQGGRILDVNGNTVGRWEVFA